MTGLKYKIGFLLILMQDKVLFDIAASAKYEPASNVPGPADGPNRQCKE
jgi:hypothetical protein